MRFPIIWIYKEEVLFSVNSKMIPVSAVLKCGRKPSTSFCLSHCWEGTGSPLTNGCDERLQSMSLFEVDKHHRSEQVIMKRIMSACL